MDQYGIGSDIMSLILEDSKMTRATGRTSAMVKEAILRCRTQANTKGKGVLLAFNQAKEAERIRYRLERACLQASFRPTLGRFRSTLGRPLTIEGVSIHTTVINDIRDLDRDMRGIKAELILDHSLVKVTYINALIEAANMMKRMVVQSGGWTRLDGDPELIFKREQHTMWWDGDKGL